MLKFMIPGKRNVKEDLGFDKITFSSTQPKFTGSQLRIETLEQGVKYVQS